MRFILRFLDKIEDHVRGRLSRLPLLYAIIGGIAIVLFWRGVWITADLFPLMTGPVSLGIGIAILLATGLFIPFFVGEEIILTGIKREKKLVEKTEAEIRTEKDDLLDIKKELSDIRKEVTDIKDRLADK